MTTKNYYPGLEGVREKDGGPAFPTRTWAVDDLDRVREGVISGMSLRDYIAAKAMQGILTSPEWLEEIRGSWTADVGPIHVISEWSYKYADAMLKAREK